MRIRKDLEDPKLPARLGYEAAGTVAAIGPGVQGFKIGDAVSVIPSNHGRQRPGRMVFDPVGGPTLTKLARATAIHGTIFIYGAVSPEPTPYPLMEALGKWLTIRGYTLIEITTDQKRLEKAKKFVNDGLADGSFKPIIAKTFPLDQIVEAHRYLESNQQIGKIVVTA